MIEKGNINTNPKPGSKHQQQLDAYEARIDDLNKEVIDLRAQVFKLRDELHALRNSRVLGRVIKLRDFITGWLVPNVIRFPRRAARKLVRLVGLLFPIKVRMAIMKRLRSLKHRAKGQLIEYRTANTQIREVPNAVWDKNTPLVSVVLPYYNRADTIDDTLDSLKAQTFRNFEIIIVDDDSTDPASIKKLEVLKTGGLKAVFIHQKNQGVAGARNTGVKQAKGKYVICLDPDDMLCPAFIEKAVVLLEADPDASIATTYMDSFGVITQEYRHAAYNPLTLYRDNMVITAAMFRKEAWAAGGGYKTSLGYEDWDYWLSLAEHGFWGKLIPEALFKYRVSMQSRYINDKDVHWNNLKEIRARHPGYNAQIKRLLAQRQATRHIVGSETAFVNIQNAADYQVVQNGKPNILITIPWMTFGGAETLIYNFCREIKQSFIISFITGLKSEHEWEYKFKEISPNIYHLANLVEGPALYLEFVSNYIATRKIDVLHIIHNGFTFTMLPELKKRHPNLKVIVTVFNDRAAYFSQSLGFEDYVDVFTADNQAVVSHYQQELVGKPTQVIPNGIDCYKMFNPELFDRQAQRSELKLAPGDIAVFFVGRLSEEKNPDVFMRVAKTVVASGQQKNVKFFIIGDGPMKWEVTKQVKAINSKRVAYIGYQPSEEVARYLSAADIFVLPSSIEGFPLSILEAMAMRVAVVASDVGAVADVVTSGRDGFVVKAGSAPEITQAIRALQKDTELLNRIKSAAQATVKKKYSNTILGGNYTRLYKEVTE